MADDIADSWEDLENGEELDKKLDKLAKPVVLPAKMKEQNNSVPKLQEDMPGRTPYQPTIKILKRETNKTQNNCTPLDKVPVKPIKTYEEREAAYAEARLRILGAAFNPEEELQPASTVGSETCVQSDSSSLSDSVISSPASSSTEHEQNPDNISTAPR